jgi:hypothetical protein
MKDNDGYILMTRADAMAVHRRDQSQIAGSTAWLARPGLGPAGNSNDCWAEGPAHAAVERMDVTPPP